MWAGRIDHILFTLSRIYTPYRQEQIRQPYKGNNLCGFSIVIAQLAMTYECTNGVGNRCESDVTATIRGLLWRQQTTRPIDNKLSGQLTFIQRWCCVGNCWWAPTTIMRCRLSTSLLFKYGGSDVTGRIPPKYDRRGCFKCSFMSFSVLSF